MAVVKKQDPLFPVTPAPPAPSAPPAATGAAPMAPPRTPTPGTGYGDSWSDLLPWSNKPARPGPQSWFDWFSKTYDPSAADMAKIYGDAWAYHTPSVALQAARAAGVPTLGATPEGYRASLEAARQAAGPGTIPLTLAGYATSPLTYSGVGPVGEAVGGVASKVLPAAAAKIGSRIASGGTQASITGAAQTAGAGGSPADIAKSALINFPIGAAITGGLAATPLGRTMTPEDVIAKTGQDVTSATNRLRNMTFTPPQGNDAARYGLSMPSGADLPAVFPRGPNPNSTGADLYANLQVLRGLKADQDPGGSAATIAQRIERNLNERAPVGGQPGEAQGAIAALADPAQRAANAQMLKSMSTTAGLPGVDVQKEAADALTAYRAGSPQFDALKGIATVNPQPPPPKWTNYLRTGLSSLGTMGGEAATHFTGIPGFATTGQFAGQGIGYGVERLLRPGSDVPQLEQQIRNSYPALTGYGLDTGAGADVLGNALMRLYSSTRPFSPQ